MEVFRIAKDAVNEVIIVNVVHADYKDLVQKRVNQKTPSATIKGFKKGKAPKEMVAKQYGFDFKIEEVNLLVNQQLEKFIKAENLNMLGTPLLKSNVDFNWEADTLVFEHEIGLVPKFDLTLENIVVTKSKIVADQEMIDNQVSRIQKQFGTLQPTEAIQVDSEIEAIFINDTENINAVQTFELTIFQNQAIRDLFIGKKVGESVVLNTKNLFEDEHKLMDFLAIEHSSVHGIEVDVTAKITKISSVEKAPLNQDLFYKVYGVGVVNSEEEMKAFIKNDAEKYFNDQAEQKLTEDIVNATITANNIMLPAEFLTKWLKTAGQTMLTDDQAAEEYKKSANSLRFQLIEEKLMDINDYRLTFEDLKSHAANTIRKQMAQYGYNSATDEEVQGIVAKSLSNQDEVRKISKEVSKAKNLEFLVSKATVTEREVTFDQYIKEFYGE